MFIRQRCGRGFTYRDEKGETVKKPELRAWFKSLVIPPAWTEVEISEDPKAPLLVTGRDEAGRKQYLYHPDYRRQKRVKSSTVSRVEQELKKARKLSLDEIGVLFLLKARLSGGSG